LIMAVLSFVILLPVNYLVNLVGLAGLAIYYLVIQKTNRTANTTQSV
jgi:hypothetical protein